jgi:putative membrane protein
MRRLALWAGFAVLVLVWGGPLLDTWRESFAAHMLAHMGVVAVAAPLIAIGLPKRWSPGASMPPALPLLASLLELVTVWGWHAPAMRDAAESSAIVTAVEQTNFLLAGFLLWSTSLGTAGQRVHAAPGAAALLLTSIHMTLLGALLSLSQRPLFGEGQVTCFGTVLSGTDDQQIGGIIMLLVGAVVYLAGGLFLVASLLVSPSQQDDWLPRKIAPH